jgi:hypothetical protein
MEQYPAAAVERMMKVQEVIMRAFAKRISWWEAAEILGVSPRTMRRMKRNWDTGGGYDGLYDRRKKTPSPKRVPIPELEKVLTLYRDTYCGSPNVIGFMRHPGRGYTRHPA